MRKKSKLKILNGGRLFSDSKTAAVDDGAERSDIDEAITYAAAQFEKNGNRAKCEHAKLKALGEADAGTDQADHARMACRRFFKMADFYFDELTRLNRVWSRKTGFPCIASAGETPALYIPQTDQVVPATKEQITKIIGVLEYLARDGKE
jgi:hypothetical protein